MISSPSLLAKDDYSSVSQILKFGPADAKMQCINLFIVDDNLVEGTERFSFSLTSSYSRALIVPDSAVMEIRDNDGK